MPVPKLRVGDVVYFYHGGNVADPPMPATVLAMFANGMLSLLVWIGGTLHEKTCVHQKDSDAVKANPAMALKRGVWDRRPEPEVAAESAKSEMDLPPVTDSSKKTASLV